jgi:DNA repair exonuclease SbcCD ATPase subunit
LEAPLEAVRTDVPDPVKQTLNMDAINLQLQGDAPFLLSESPPEVARILNNIAGLDGIDTAHTRIAAKTRENQEEARNLVSQLAGVNECLMRFDGVDDLKAKLEHLRELEESNARKQEQLSELGSLLEEQGTITDKLKATEGMKGLQERTEALQKQTQTLQAGQKQVSALNDLLTNAVGYLGRLEKTEGVESLAERVKGLSNSIQAAGQRVIALSLLESTGRKAEALTASVGRLSEEAVAKADSVCLAVLKSLSALSDKARQLSTLYSIGVSIAEIEKRKPDPNEEAGIMDALKELGACGTCGAAPEHWRL